MPIVKFSSPVEISTLITVLQTLVGLKILQAKTEYK